MTNSSRFRLAILLVVLLLPLVVSAQPFEIGHYVIASGGGSNSTGSSGGQTFRVDGTVGQNLAGTTSTGPNGDGGQFSLRGGFWAFQPLSPTAAAVRVSGRVVTANGVGIRRALITLSDPNATSRYAVTNTFGFFRFEGVPVGRMIVLSVSHARYTFAEPVFALDIFDDVAEIRFVSHRRRP